MPLRAIIWTAVSTKAQDADDKDSLPAQERDGLALAGREGWPVVQVLKVPGFSRDYIDIHECAADMRRQGIDAFDCLLDLWASRGFDVLICRDGNRFARTQTLHAYVTEKTIQIGARIYSMLDGWVDDHNYRMFIAMNGYKAAAELDELVKKREVGIQKRVMELGLPTNRTPYGFLLVRDPHSGRAIDLVIKESMRPIFDGMAVLILEGVSWNTLGQEMYNRFGHVNPTTGRPEASNWGYGEVYNPFWWGNAARHYANQAGTWAFDPSVEPPPRVIIRYGTHEPIWAGELGEKIKAELRRRDGLVIGKRTAGSTYLFTGLLKCDECGASLSAKRNGVADLLDVKYVCYSHYRVLRTIKAGCSQRQRITVRTIRQFVNSALEFLIDHGTLTALDAPARVIDEQPIRDAIAAQDKLIRNLITLRAADLELAYLYDAELEAAKKQLRDLKLSLREAMKSALPIMQDHDRQRFVAKYRGRLPSFWQRPPVEINQDLYHVLGTARLYVRDGQIIDLR